MPKKHTDSHNSLQLLNKWQKNQIQWLLILLLSLGYALVAVAQNNLNDLNFAATSSFVPTIKDAIKFSDIPEIKDSVKRIERFNYSINSTALAPKYEVQPVEAAKLQNEALPKLYHSLLKLGYAPIYNMPYGEFWLGNVRARESNYGLRLKHFSSTTWLRNFGYGGFSDNEASAFAKKFYKKHTLTSDFKYQRNVVHYYGYDTSLTDLSKTDIKQRYQLFEPKLRLQSHYTDSSHINHDIQLGYYNLQNLHKETENNIKLNAAGNLFVNKEKLNINFLTDFYNHKQANDTLNDLIVSINPSFEANGKKWHADLGLTGTLDNFKNKTLFYFYPQLNIHYDIYESILVPYMGVTGGLVKNSFRSLSTENMFVDTILNYQNTNNRYTIFGGLRGNLSSKTTYNTKVSFSQLNNLHFFVLDYDTAHALHNRFKVVYDNTTLLQVNGQLKYQLNEKLSLSGTGNYYLYKTKTLIRPYHKPDFDFTLSGCYNLKSKFILRVDLFIMGNQWALSPISKGSPTLKPKLINGWGDLNLEAEYRYSKMLSFFTRFNNIANQRYYRWEQFPTQRFNFMLGLSFIPF